MSDVVILRGIPIDLPSAEGHQFVVDCVRAAEGLISDSDIKSKYELSPEDWKGITQSTALARAIRAEREKRIYNGTAARELAATQFATAPRILGEILTDKSASPRHRIESARELRQTAHASAENATDAGTKFVITIDLGAGHIAKYEKDITPTKPLIPMIEDKTDE